ncbi:MAG: TRASH domain-containing protein [Deltaproteobacteria bacterium]|nr:TRASH domain-containing protein [Deltaproteobacteria bacterium]
MSAAYGASQKTSKEALKGVKPDIVCMVNDEVMNKPQIPVEFEGKTYYGCCPACVTTLKTDRTARYAKDPLTGKEVDKAKAFITEGDKGAALYFESSDTAGKYYGPQRAN